MSDAARTIILNELVRYCVKYWYDRDADAFGRHVAQK